MSRENIDPRVRQVQLGIEIEAFLHGPIGKYLADKAEEERETALESLATVDPEDAKRIRELQNDHWRGSTFMCWLVEAVQAAAHAESELTVGE